MSTLKRLRNGFEAGGCPHAPERVEVSVTGPTEVAVRLWEPEMIGHGPYTKFRVQWCHTDSFSKIEGEATVTHDVTGLTCGVSGLAEGRRYFVRASFGNMKGFGPFCASTPKSVVPSSWRSVKEHVPRFRDQREVCREALETLGVGGVSGGGGGGSEDDADSHSQGFFNKRKGGLVRHFFSTSSAPKLQRHLHPNRIYLACTFFHEDKVLMTNEEVLPIMEVADGSEFPPSINSEHQWFASKLCNAWRDAERLKHEASKLNTASQGFRARLIQAAVHMQHALGVTDLGGAYHRPYRHHSSDGPVVFSTSCHVRQPKSLVSLSLKWVPLSKAQRRSAYDEVSPMDALRYGLREQILYRQVKNQPNLIPKSNLIY